MQRAVTTGPEHWRGSSSLHAPAAVVPVHRTDAAHSRASGLPGVECSFERFLSGVPCLEGLDHRRQGGLIPNGCPKMGPHRIRQSPPRNCERRRSQEQLARLDLA